MEVVNNYFGSLDIVAIGQVSLTWNVAVLYLYYEAESEGITLSSQKFD